MKPRPSSGFAGWIWSICTVAVYQIQARQGSYLARLRLRLSGSCGLTCGATTMIED